MNVNIEHLTDHQIYGAEFFWETHRMNVNWTITGSEENPRILRYPKYHLPSSEEPSTGHYPALHASVWHYPIFSYICFNIIYSSIPSSSKESNFFKYSHKIVLRIYLLSHSCYMHRPSHIFILYFLVDQSNSTFWGVHFMKLLIVLCHLSKNSVILGKVPSFSSNKVMICLTFILYLLLRNSASNTWLHYREQ
jgi:hypothetical protein